MEDTVAALAAHGELMVQVVSFFVGALTVTAFVLALQVKI